MPSPPALYLAGPDIFFPDARAIAARKKALCVQAGFTPLHPLDGDLPTAPTPAETALAIYRGNRARMLAAAGILADLTPFRSPSADPGTVFELGFMVALDRPAFGYSHTALPFRARTAATLPGTHQDASGTWRDGAGAELEDFGLHDNLMIDCALTLGGHPIHVPTASHPDPFEAALAAARARFFGA